MLYLTTQIVLCLALATLLGLVIGWWLHALTRRSQEGPLRQENEQLAERVDLTRRERDRLIDQRHELEQERDAMRQQILNLTATNPGGHASVEIGSVSRVDVDSADLSDHLPASEPSQTTWEFKARTTSNVAAFDVADFEQRREPTVVAPPPGAAPVPPQPETEAEAVVPQPETESASGHAIEQIEGVGKGYGKRLRALGIDTTDDLLLQCRTADGRSRITEHLALEEFVVRKWANMADFMRIPGVSGQIAGLLDRAGATSLGELATRHPHPLATRLAELAVQEASTVRPPSTGEVRAWIEIAKHLLRQTT
ncbi:MAG: DUF4332 domain-containing protein [Thiotrichales bacterium]